MASIQAISSLTNNIEERKMKRKLILLAGSLMSFLFSVTPVFAAGFDTGTAQSTINQYLDPLRQFLLWFVPVAFVVSALISGSKWFFMDEQEREQKPITKTLTKLAIAAVVIWSVPVIATILGLTS
jgi:cytochrome bd-type quinol oxidase subunit 2